MFKHFRKLYQVGEDPGLHKDKQAQEQDTGHKNFEVLGEISLKGL